MNFVQIIPNLIIANNPKTVEEVVYITFKQIPPELHRALLDYASILTVEMDCKEHQAAIQKLLLDISRLELYSIVRSALKKLEAEVKEDTAFVKDKKATEVATLLLLATPMQTFLTLGRETLSELNR